MHTVNLAELQCTWGADEPLNTMSGSVDLNNQGVHVSKPVDIGSINHDSDCANQDFITDDNFSWLVNFKLDDLIHASTPTNTTGLSSILGLQWMKSYSFCF